MKCDDCSRELNCVKNVLCPFSQEVCKKKIPVNLCGCCYKKRCKEVKKDDSRKD